MERRAHRVVDLVAFVVSALASPFITVSACAVGVIARHTASIADAAVFGTLFFALVVVLPGVWIGIGVRRGRYTDPHVMLREQRAEPFLVANLGALALVLLYVVLRAPVALQAAAVNTLVNGVLFMLITRFWKVSIHSAAYATSVFLASALVHPAVAWLGLGFPVVVWARLHRQRHSLAQALTAAAVVLASTVAVLVAFGLLPTSHT